MMPEELLRLILRGKTMVDIIEQAICLGDPCSTVGSTLIGNPCWPPLSNIVEEVNRELDLGNPVSCWARRAAWVLSHLGSAVHEEVDPVQVGVREALNSEAIPQTMVGTIMVLACQLAQVINGPDGDRIAASRLVEVLSANCVSLPLEKVLEQLMVDPDRIRDIGSFVRQETLRYRINHPELQSLFSGQESSI
jgi:hypothetical protein